MIRLSIDFFSLRNPVFLGLAALAVAWAVASLTWPLGYDQGLFAWVGWSIRNGGLPYLDAWEIKGPAVYYTYALTQMIFGHNAWGVRVVDLLLLGAAAWVFFRLIRDLGDARTAWWSTVLFVLWYGSGTFYATAQPDGWVGLLLLMAFAPLLRSSTARVVTHYGAAGFVIGVATLMKFLFAGFLPVLAVSLWARRRDGVVRTTGAGAGVAAAAGFLVPILLTIVWFASHGALGALVEAHIQYPAQVYADIGTPGMAARARGLVEWLLTGRVFVIGLPLSIVGLVSLVQRDVRRGVVVVVWMLMALGLVVFQNKFFEYHWYLLLPPFAVTAALGAHELAKGATLVASTLGTQRERLVRTFAAAYIALLAFHCSVHAAFETARFGAWVAGVTDTDGYYAGFGVPGSDRLAARHLQKATAENERLAIWGWSTGVLYLSQRESNSRFGSSLPLVMGQHSELRTRYRAEFLRALEECPPSVIVVDPTITSMFGAPADLPSFPEFARVLDERYSLTHTIGQLVLYERVVEPTGPPWECH